MTITTTETTIPRPDTPSIDTLVGDIYALFGSDKIYLKPEYLDTFKDELSKLVSDRLRRDENEHNRLRMSNLGKPDRQIWYDVNWQGEKEPLTPPNLIKFMYGDVLEHLMLLLARQAGHIVEMEQAEVEIDGILGHPDAVIDGVVVDVKSASSWQFNKFKSLDELSKDIWLSAYLQQLAGYVEAINPDADGAFLAIDKTLGKLELLRVPNEVLRQTQVRDRVAHLKEVVASTE